MAGRNKNKNTPKGGNSRRSNPADKSKDEVKDKTNLSDKAKDPEESTLPSNKTTDKQISEKQMDDSTTKSPENGDKEDEINQGDGQKEGVSQSEGKIAQSTEENSRSSATTNEKDAIAKSNKIVTIDDRKAGSSGHRVKKKKRSGRELSTDSDSDISSSFEETSEDESESSDSDRDYRRRRKRKANRYLSKKKNKKHFKLKRKIRSRSRSRSRSCSRAKKLKRRSVADSDVESDFEARVEAAVQRRLFDLKRKNRKMRDKDTDTGIFSDSTLYMPAVRKRLSKGAGSSSPPINKRRFLKLSGDKADAISEFLKRVRLDSSDPKGSNDEQTMRHVQETDDAANKEGAGAESEMETACQQAEKAIIDAEKYKAALAPKGKDQQINRDVDDEFFHVTCHVETALRMKCSMGEFVDLEKLIPKLRMTGKNRVDTRYDQKFELVTKEGQAFVVPSADKESKITNVRKWEQAFRIYAAIYSQANPDRAAEIWQYVHVINTAAASFLWENVACYDMTFRHLMAANPTRSWAKIYTQGWSLAMRDPLPAGKLGGNPYQHPIGRPGNKNGGGFRQGICWKYNQRRKNKCNFGARCRFDHKCNHCFGAHPAASCSKKTGGKRQTGEGNTGEGAAGEGAAQK